MAKDRFHGRCESGEECAAPGCGEPGQFRAPGARLSGFDGPGDYRWFCLDHVRAFNAGYDFFAGMSADEILDAQSPVFGWRRESAAFSPTAGVGGAPRWADFEDPLEAISARARGVRDRARHQAHAQAGARNSGLPEEDSRALAVLGLGADTDRATLRRRYTQLVRRYHPDRNGGDRSHEVRLTKVVGAYQHLRRTRRFS